MMDLICGLPLIASRFASCAPMPPLARGYVEVEYVLLAPVEVGRIEALSNKRGDRVAKGEVIPRGLPNTTSYPDCSA